MLYATSSYTEINLATSRWIATRPLASPCRTLKPKGEVASLLSPLAGAESKILRHEPQLRSSTALAFAVAINQSDKQSVCFTSTSLGSRSMTM